MNTSLLLLIGLIVVISLSAVSSTIPELLAILLPVSFFYCRRYGFRNLLDLIYLIIPTLIIFDILLVFTNRALIYSVNLRFLIFIIASVYVSRNINSSELISLSSYLPANPEQILMLVIALKHLDRFLQEFREIIFTLETRYANIRKRSYFHRILIYFRAVIPLIHRAVVMSQELHLSLLSRTPSIRRSLLKVSESGGSVLPVMETALVVVIWLTLHLLT